MSVTALSSAGTTPLRHELPSIFVNSPTPTPPPTYAQGSPNAIPMGGFAAPLPSYRLLYRGALSLPDSLLPLDGLTFAARLDSPSKQSTFHLLENPLALALESMRGRPTLRWMGVVNLKDVYLDESGRVEMDIHPLAVLSQIYFENTFCLLPFASSSRNTVPERSEIGVKVALGDSNGPETTEIVIFAQRAPCIEDANNIRLYVGRVTPQPAQPQVKPRGPRPDDPTPRRPPAFFIRDLKRTGSLNNIGGLKRVASSGGATTGPLKKQKTLGAVAGLGSGVRLGEEVVFKVPDLPKQAKGKGKEKDVFGDVSEVQRGVASANGKQKADDKSEAGLEKASKNAIKKATIDYLAKTKDPTDSTRFIDKSHPEFKDLYGYIYRGVGYALRSNIRLSNIDSNVINGLIDKHALMYLPGCSGSPAHPASK
ncbi:hypothetical protein BDN70DRAFT_79522 [Pholiota conissans]|uniref:Sld7 C-terminal domain-containing protein n=1 Tax=Pholiota conissans TaxID=109636 RepID=A0A9P6CZP1_9AGAR|nr:hypothetical protein BDN70DRAFT_79522 [Pholiota conissans]